MLRIVVNQTVSILKSAMVGFSQGAAVHSLSVGIIALSLTALGAFGVMVHQVSRLADAWGRDLTVTAFLRADVPGEEVEKLRGRASRLRGAMGASIITREHARDRLRMALGARADLLEGMDDRVIPTAVEVELSPDATRDDSAAVAETLRGEEIVEEVAWGEEELRRLSAVVNILQLAAALLGSLIALVTVLVISNTLKLTVLARREEIAIMKLVGASDLFVRLPFLLEGAAQGMLGAALASGTLVGVHQLAAWRVEEVLSAAFGPVSLGGSPLWMVGWLMLLGAVLGVVGGLVGVSRFLKV
ncbi:MAG: permease-like cell division protein FtsX [Myxococcota bacterium]